MDENRLLLFIPETGIYPYARGLAVIGDSYQRNGGITYITKCTGQMIRCPMMDMHLLPPDYTEAQKTDICKNCSANSASIAAKYKFEPIDLANYVSTELYDTIKKLTNLPDASLNELRHKDFPVGKIAEYDFILSTKHPFYVGLSNQHRSLYVSYVQNTILALEISLKIFAELTCNKVITFNEYAQCQAVRYAAALKNVGRLALTYPTHLNVDASRFMIWRSTCEYWRYKHCQNWDQGKNLPIAAKNVENCWADAIFRMYSAGSHIFSAKKTRDPEFLFKELGLSANKKNIVVFTSSNDERISVEIGMRIWNENPETVDAFSSQIEWLKALQKFSLTRSDVQIIVRIHPREGIRRQGGNSRNLELLKSEFLDKSSGLIVVWPDNPISSYDLMELADVCLVQWSLMGQEAARVGIPVLSTTKNMFYPDDDFMQVGSSPSEYIQKLELLLDFDYTWEHLLKAVRFYHWRIFLPSLNLGDAIPSDFNDETIWPILSDEQSIVVKNIVGSEDLINYNKEKWVSLISKDAESEEVAAMLKGIRTFILRIFYPEKAKITIDYHKQKVFIVKLILYGINWVLKIFDLIFAKKIGIDLNADFNLIVVFQISKFRNLIHECKHDRQKKYLIINGASVVFIQDKYITKRTSPMIAKLGKLYFEKDKQ